MPRFAMLCRVRRSLYDGAVALACLSPALVWAAPAADPVQFNRDIRPILSENCFQCHGPDRHQRKADLRLDLEAEALKDLGGHRAIVPGRPLESELHRRVTTSDPDDVMPPPKSGLKLTAAEKELLSRWITQGAKWQGHWAFVTPTAPSLPPMRRAGWARNPIDQFVLARLEREGLKPSTEADRATLIRRVSLDLTGLPPTPADVAEFLRDPAPDAYEKVVDRLLRSPHYGERMALPWLDAARYADTHGYQKDNERTMWAWRDWVIGAFNSNLPFDQFTVEQLAGDLLPQPTLAQRIATGFNRNHRINAEAGAIAEEYRAEYVADRAETTATVWLGLTVACARCHDHKFDPITQKDYYRLFAFFNNVEENGVDGVGPSPVPQLSVPVPGYEAPIAAAEARLQEANRRYLAQAQGLQSEQTRWEESRRTELAKTSAAIWSIADQFKTASAEGMKFERLEDFSILGSGPNPLNDVHTVTFAFDDGVVSAIRLEALPHETHERGSLARSFDGNFVLSGFDVELVRPGEKPQPLALQSAQADYSEPGWPIAAAIDADPNTGWAVAGGTRREQRTALFALREPVTGSTGAQLLVRLRYQSKEEQSIIGRFRLATTSAAEPSLAVTAALPAAVIAALRTAPAARSAAAQETIFDYFRTTSSTLAPIRGEVEAARRELAALRRRATTTVMVMNERTEPRDTFVFARGLYDRPGDKVTAGVPASLPGLKTAAAAPNRLDLARWLVAPENPLTARVAVNRYWQMYFGAGLVKSTEDFGTQGDWPSHPELLDWLATEFMRTGWDVKAMQRLIVTSAVYRQESKVSAALLERDPENRLLARGPRFRLPAQFIRDQALAASGLLVPRLGGPPVKPYQPEGLWSATAGINSNTTKYEPDTGESLHRRSLYSYWKRAVPPPAMMVFDAADREVCSVKRRLTNTPLQALNLLNDITYVEAARALAAQVLAPPASSEAERIRRLWQRVLAREPSQREVQQATAALGAYQAKFRQAPAAAAQFAQASAADAVTSAAWSTLAAVVLNLDETVTKE
jgi:hypothetical protein